ncbi:MAG: HAD family phosphatase [Bacteroidales bacterium]
MSIKNIIFDLGGVILNVDYHKSINKFKSLGIADFEKLFTQAKQNKLFDLLDTGEISPEGFRDKIREYGNTNLTDNQIDEAWNAMLLDLPKERIELLQKVKKKYRTFLLSNTNAIHYPEYMRYMKSEFGVENLSELFEKEYLSHEIGMRKPNTETFTHITREQGLNPQETLFIDDTKQHVEGARKAGLNAYWLDITKGSIIDIFDNDLNFKKDINNNL